MHSAQIIITANHHTIDVLDESLAVEKRLLSHKFDNLHINISTNTNIEFEIECADIASVVSSLKRAVSDETFESVCITHISLKTLDASEIVFRKDEHLHSSFQLAYCAQLSEVMSQTQNEFLINFMKKYF